MSKLMCSRVRASRYDIPSISGSTVDSDETEADLFAGDVRLCLTYAPPMSKTGDGGRDDTLELDPLGLVDPSCDCSILLADPKTPP